MTWWIHTVKDFVNLSYKILLIHQINTGNLSSQVSFNSCSNNFDNLSNKVRKTFWKSFMKKYSL